MSFSNRMKYIYIIITKRETEESRTESYPGRSFPVGVGSFSAPRTTFEVRGLIVLVLRAIQIKAIEFGVLMCVGFNYKLHWELHSIEKSVI